MLRKLVVSAAVVTGAVGLTAAGAFAGAQLTSALAPATHAITGIVNANPSCTQQLASNRYSSAPSTNGCTITIPGAAFTATPVPVLSFNGGTITGIAVNFTGGNWTVAWSTSAPGPMSFSIEKATS
jgi:hypothetical protein